MDTLEKRKLSMFLGKYNMPFICYEHIVCKSNFVFEGEQYNDASFLNLSLVFEK